MLVGLPGAISRLAAEHQRQVRQAEAELPKNKSIAKLEAGIRVDLHAFPPYACNLHIFDRVAGREGVGAELEVVNKRLARLRDKKGPQTASAHPRPGTGNPPGPNQPPDYARPQLYRPS
eukprot:3050128-Rhodomonas_salina.5